MDEKLRNFRKMLIRNIEIANDLSDQMSPAEIEYEVLEIVVRVKSSALHFLDVACDSCGGRGRKGYSSTSTYHGGPGGSAITMDVCDVCWGTGRSDQKGSKPRHL